MSESSFALSHGWPVVRLGDMEESNLLWMKSGFPCGSNNQERVGIPQLRPMNIDESGQIDLSSVKFIQVNRDVSGYLVRNEDVIFNNTNSRELVGKTALWDERSGDYVLSNHMTIIRFADRSDVEPSFFALYFHFLWLNHFFERIRRQHVNQASISLERLRNIEVPLPPLFEQRAIARTLRTIQRAKDIRQRELALERERKATLMEHLFQYGVGGTAVPARKTRFGPIPMRWQVLLLRDCAYVQTGVAKGRRLRGDHKFVTVPYLRVANVQDGYLDLSEIKEIRLRESELIRFSLRPDDVLVTEGGDFDKLGRGFIWHNEVPNCVHQNHIFAIRVKSELMLPQFLAFLIQSQYGKAYFLSVAHKTTNLASINSSKLLAFPVIIPEFREQEQMVEILDRIDSKIAAVHHEIEVMEELFRAMLDEMMTRRLRTTALPHNQHSPSEEHADG